MFSKIKKTMDDLFFGCSKFKNNKRGFQNFDKIYWICTIVLFLGLLWMFLPHAAHGAITGEAEETEHYEHIIQGLIPTLLALIGMIWNEKYSSKESK